MKGFGKHQSKKEETQTNQEEIKQAFIAYTRQEIATAKRILRKILKAEKNNTIALGLLGTIEKSIWKSQGGHKAVRTNIKNQPQSPGHPSQLLRTCK